MTSQRLEQSTQDFLTDTIHLPGQHIIVLSNGTSGRQFIPLPNAGYIFIGCMLSVTWSCGSFLNGLCLFLFAKNRRLHSATNVFIMALNLCDFLMCFVGTPAAMLSAWSRHWIWGDAACDAEAFTVYFLGMASMYLLMAIAFDRYIAISHPIQAKRISITVAVASCGFCYFLGFFWAILPAFGWNEFGLEGAGISCSVVWETDDPVYTSYIWVIFFFCLVIPLGIMFYAYWGVLNTLRGLNQNSVWDVNSRIAQRNLAIEKKMLKTSVLIVASYLGCWMPYTVVSFVAAFFGSHHIPSIFATIPPVIAKCQGIFNPIIYVATNKQMRTALFEMIPCSKLRKSLLNEKGEEVVAETESEESDFETQINEKATTSAGGKKTKGKEKSKGTKNPGKKNQVTPVDQPAKGGKIEDKGETSVSFIQATQTDDEVKVSYSKTSAESSH